MIKIEKTDTFGGEANYSWVERYELDFIDSQTDRQLMRRIKKTIGWTGVRCKVERYNNMIELRPYNFCNVAFITLWED